MKNTFLLLIIFCFCCFSCIQGKNETVQVYAATTKTYLIPAFSKQSNFSDFNETLNFFYLLDYQWFNAVYLVRHFETFSWDDLFDYPNSTFLENIYNNSVYDTNIIPTYLEFEITNIKSGIEECVTGKRCIVDRINVIFLTDVFNFAEVTFTKNFQFKQVFYYAFLSVNQECIQPSSTFSSILCLNIIKDVPNSELGEKIFEPIIYYTFDPANIKYTYFIVSNDSELNTLMSIPHYLQITDAEYDGATLFVTSLQVNESYFYESATVIFDMSSPFLISSIREFVYSNTSTLSTNLTEYYLKQIYNNPDENDQFNIIITDRFPFWLINTNITFDSFYRHLDIYFYSNNNTEVETEFLTNLSQNIDKILVNDDGNASRRLNHFIIIEDDTDTFLNHQYFPTGKLLMPSNKNFKIFSPTVLPPFQKEPTKFWIWIVSFGSAFIVIVVITVVAFLKWRKRMHQKFEEEKYSWALKAGFTPQEAETFTSNGKELYIDEKFIEVNYEIIKGKGSSAIVYAGMLNTVSPIAILKPCLETSNFKNCNVAVKIVNKYGKDDYEQIFREVEAGIKLGWHRHICCLLGWSIHQSTPALIYEYIDGEDLHCWIKNNSNDISEKEVAQILWQIADGMEYLATLGIVHKDLAARNIMLTKSLVAKITDFGLASMCDESFTYQAPVQRRLPIRWMAPETMTERRFSEFSDVWSYGVLIWEIFTRCLIPYGSIDGNDIFEFLQTGNRLKLPDSVSDEWKELCQNCWKENPKERLNFKNIKEKLSILLEKYTCDYGYISVTDD